MNITQDCKKTKVLTTRRTVPYLKIWYTLQDFAITGPHIMLVAQAINQARVCNINIAGHFQVLTSFKVYNMIVKPMTDVEPIRIFTLNITSLVRNFIVGMLSLGLFDDKT